MLLYALFESFGRVGRYRSKVKGTEKYSRIVSGVVVATGVLAL